MLPIPGTNQNGRQLFYCNGRISTEINGDARWRFLQANDLILAQNNHKTPGFPSTLAACDQQRSVLSMYEGRSPESYAYSPYGHHTQGSGLLSLLAFNGERRDAVSGHYHLGNGYRQFSPVMMRFCSPDSWSPFGEGGFNAYVYCAGDPSNRIDPTGHAEAKVVIARKLNQRKLHPKELHPIKLNSIELNQREPHTRSKQEVVKPTLLASKKYIKKRDGSVGVAPSETKQVYFQSHDANKDVDAAERYAQLLGVHKIALQKENEVRETAKLKEDLLDVKKRMSGAGASRDIMIEAALQEEIRKRV